MGLPGDMIKITDGKISVNNRLVLPPEKAILKKNLEIDVFTKSEIYYTYKTNWTPYNFGIYVIPKKGMKIQLSPQNISLYENLINNDGKSNILDNKEIWKTKSSYTFQNNYLFFVGDNRTESLDSRMFGLIKTSNVKGKVILKIL